MKNHIKKIFSPAMKIHYTKLVLRSLLFAYAALGYIVVRFGNGEFPGMGSEKVLLWVIWGCFMFGMILRALPSKHESMGCQKQFSKNYEPTGKPLPAKKRTLAGPLGVLLAWVALNGVIGVLYYVKLIDKGILLLISLAYSVCDVICILFFCPFQEWIMKNSCCVTCRIYNWDYAMMFTPLAFIRGFFTWTLVGASLLLLLRWELAAHISPERFSPETNKCLSCAQCTEKLCRHKKRLLRLRQKLRRNK